jgi:hypothetical protein
MVHNDLHAGNIMIESYAEPTELTYVVNGKVCKFTTGYKALIFDFDRSYSILFGDNRLLEDYGDYCQTNEFIPNKDVIKIFGYIYRYTKHEGNRSTILDIICGQFREKRKLLHETYTHLYENWGDFLIKRFDNKPFNRVDFASFNSTEGIIKIISSFNGISSDKDGIVAGVTKNLFICNPEYFDSSDGQIIPEAIQNDTSFLRYTQVDEYKESIANKSRFKFSGGDSEISESKYVKLLKQTEDKLDKLSVKYDKLELKLKKSKKELNAYKKGYIL